MRECIRDSMLARMLGVEIYWQMNCYYQRKTWQVFLLLSLLSTLISTFFLLLGTSVRKTLAPIFDVFLGSFRILFIICLGSFIVIRCTVLIS